MIEPFKNTSVYFCIKKHSDSEIDKTELKLGFKFPSLYKTFLKEIGSGYFSIDYKVTLPNGASLQSFYPLKTILKIAEDYSANEIPEGFIPFASDNSGNLFCFKKGESNIYFVDHSFHTVDKLTKDFKNLLNLIKP